jgi:type II secretory pathway pseudopilin PulG
MKRAYSSMLGVTLLEIMLVLAIAAMIIVMSVRYYQSANASQQANIVLSQIQSITAAADGLAQASGSYSVAGVSSGTLLPVLPSVNGLTTPWGEKITITGASTTTYDVSIPNATAAVCVNLISKLMPDKHYSSLDPSTPAGCSGTKSISYTYISNP